MGLTLINASFFILQDLPSTNSCLSVRILLTIRSGCHLFSFTRYGMGLQNAGHSLTPFLFFSNAQTNFLIHRLLSLLPLSVNRRGQKITVCANVSPILSSILIAIQYCVFSLGKCYKAELLFFAPPQQLRYSVFLFIPAPLQDINGVFQSLVLRN